MALHVISNSMDKNLNVYQAEEFLNRVLNDAGFIKTKSGLDRKVKWPKFAFGLDKVWVEKYITSDFDKDVAWNYIKMVAWLDTRYPQNNDQRYNIWYPKQNRISAVKDMLKNHLKYGGIVKMKFNKRFECFIPIGAGSNSVSKMTVEKGDKGEKTYYLEVSASNTKVDK